MEIVTEKTVANKTLSVVSPISQTIVNPQTIVKPTFEETVGDNLGSVVVTTTAVKETEVSVVEMTQEDKEDESIKNQEVTESEKEEFVGKLEHKDEGLKENCDENVKSVNMDVEGSFECENQTPVDHVLEKKSDFEILESKEDMNTISKENVENVEANGKVLAGEDETDHDFVLGDFVWAKIKSHSWFPGQICDPCDASNYAAPSKREGELLVACFGDKSFSWCSPSQLKPFIDNFQEMSKQSNSKKFVNAVQKALEEVSRLVEGELMCKCQTVSVSKNKRVVNREVKGRVRMPKGNTIKGLMDRTEPVDLVSTLKGYAMMEPGAGLVKLELTVLKSCVHAFYTQKNGYLFLKHHEPKCIEGPKEQTESETSGFVESPENGDEELYQKRKQKSVAELLGEDESKLKKPKTCRDGVKERKRKVLVVSVTPENNHDSGGGGGVEEEIMSPRQRKKSKYLSPPYLSPVGTVRPSVSGSASFKEPKPERAPEMAAEELEDSLKKSSSKKARQKKQLYEGSDSQEHGVNVTKLLDWLLCAALDPLFVEKNIPELTKFVSSFRSFIFKGWPRSKIDQKKDGENTTSDVSDVAFVKQKLEWMRAMVRECDESEMNADVQASLEGGINEVLENLVKMQGR